MLKLPQNIVTLILGLLIINAVGFWTVYLLSKPNSLNFVHETTERNSTQSGTNQSKLANIAQTSTNNNLVASDQAQLLELKQQLTEVSQAVATLAALPVSKQSNQQFMTSSPANNKEYVVYLGSGSTTSRDWVDLEGTRTTLNSINYPLLKAVTFQASLGILGGEAHARLINKTTGAILDSTQVSHNTATLTWVSSATFLLFSGSNEYLVQLKSTSGEKALLDGARLRILAQ